MMSAKYGRPFDPDDYFSLRDEEEEDVNLDDNDEEEDLDFVDELDDEEDEDEEDWDEEFEEYEDDDDREVFGRRPRRDEWD